MKKEYLTMAIFLIFIGFIFLSPTLSIGQGSTPLEDLCAQVKKNYFAAEQEWSSLNADVSFIREELERFRNFRWETKITLSVLDDALKIIKEMGTLTDAQRLTLNSSMPNNRGMMNPDGTFTIIGLEGSPFKLDEAKVMITRLLARSEENIKKTETELKEKEEKSHLLSQKLAAQEELVEKECKATGIPTPWEQGLPRTVGKDIYQRYVEREKMRQEEVESRRLSDIERLWLREYYNYPYPPPYPPYTHSPYPYGSRALLIELRNVNNTRTCLRCYSLTSSLQERQIYGQLDWAVRKHDSIPCVGPLGEYRVVQIYDNIQDCYARMSR